MLLYAPEGVYGARRKHHRCSGSVEHVSGLLMFAFGVSEEERLDVLFQKHSAIN